MPKLRLPFPLADPDIIDFAPHKQGQGKARGQPFDMVFSRYRMSWMPAAAVPRSCAMKVLVNVIGLIFGDIRRISESTPPSFTP